jgi:hypothetical protein
MKNESAGGQDIPRAYREVIAPHSMFAVCLPRFPTTPQIAIWMASEFLRERATLHPFSLRSFALRSRGKRTSDWCR